MFMTVQKIHLHAVSGKQATHLIAFTSSSDAKQLGAKVDRLQKGMDVISITLTIVEWTGFVALCVLLEVHGNVFSQGS